MNQTLVTALHRVIANRNRKQFAKDMKKKGFTASFKELKKHKYETDEDVTRIEIKSKGKVVGYADFGYFEEEGQDVVWRVHVDPKLRRKGIAMFMYDLIEDRLDEPLQPFPGGHSSDAQKLWNKRIEEDKDYYGDLYDSWF